MENDSCTKPVLDEPCFSIITDFDSPLPSKPIVDCNSNRGGDEIRDILNDLSSRLDLLSIDRRRGTHKLDEDCSGLFPGGDIEKQTDVLDFASTTSPFSGSPPGVNNTVGDGVLNGCDEGYLLNNSSCNNFVDKLHKTDGSGQGLTKNELGGAGGKLMTQGNSVGSNVEEEEQSNLGIESEGVNYIKRESKTETITHVKMKHESKRVDERIRLGRQSYMHILRDEEEDKGESFICSGKKEAEDIEMHGFKESYVIDLSDDSADDDSVLEEKGSITFSCSRYDYNLPAPIANMLYPHQRDGLKWLWTLHCQGKGGILGDDMGLGKTMQVNSLVRVYTLLVIHPMLLINIICDELQICGFLAGLFHSKLIKRAMVVAPKTLLPHWIKELSCVGLSEKIRE